MKSKTSKKKTINIHDPRETGVDRYITLARRKQYFSESAIIKAISASLLIYQMYRLNPLDHGLKIALVAILAKTLYFLVSSGVWILYFDKTTFVTKSERKVIKEKRMRLFVGAFIALLLYLGITATKYVFTNVDGKLYLYGKDNLERNGARAPLTYNEFYALIYGALFMLH